MIENRCSIALTYYWLIINFFIIKKVGSGYFINK